MGSGSYSQSGHDSYVRTHKVKQRSLRENFQNRSLHESVDPRNFNKDVRKYVMEPGYLKGTGVRQSCLLAEHPNVTDIYTFCDVTGSMGRIPQDILQNQFPYMMQKLIQAGVPDPELGFGAVGDHKSDGAPIQFTQIEPNSEKLLPQIQNLYIEEGGGGNGGESYHLAWWLALNHIESEAFYEQGRKPFLFTIGDEPCHSSLDGETLKHLFGYKGNVPGISTKDLLKKVQEKYHVYHIHVVDGNYRDRPVNSWKRLLGENVIVCNSEEVCDKIAETVISVLQSEGVLFTGTDRDVELINQLNDEIDDLLEESQPYSQVDEMLKDIENQPIDDSETDPLGDVLGF